MDILEAFDLYGSYRAAAKHVRCSPNTVKKCVLAREAGDPLPKRVTRAKLTDAYHDKIAKLVDRSEGNIMAKKAQRDRRPGFPCSFGLLLVDHTTSVNPYLSGLSETSGS